MAKKYTIRYGKLFLKVEEADEGGFVVTSPLYPGLCTQAETVGEAFEMAADGLKALVAARRKPLPITPRRSYAQRARRMKRRDLERHLLFG